MKNDIRTNKLSIYLIKEEFDSPKKIIKDFDKLQSIYFENDDESILSFKKKDIHPPQWIDKFFLRASKDFELVNSSSKAIFITRIRVDNDNYRYFTIPFGTGIHLLNNDAIQERFGLKVVLNTIDENQLRCIDKKNMTNVPKHTREQISVNGIAADFGIDFEQDLVFSITGKSNDGEFGKTVTGKDALNVSVKVNIENIKPFLKNCFKQFIKQDYKTNFGWIDQIAEVKSSDTIERLNEKVVEKIRNNDLDKLWMAVPELINWEDSDGFNYSSSIKDEKIDDISIKSFLLSISKKGENKKITLNELLNNYVYGYSSSNEMIRYKWKAYNCIYCEIEEQDSTFIITNGKWYKIENDFVKLINKDYLEILNKKCSLQFPEYEHENEGEYNKSISDKNNKFFLMDKKNIQYGGGYNKIEFCDLYSEAGEIIHIKKYGGSSVLSHLFNQGLVSGELFKSDKDFREKVNAKLEKRYKFQNANSIDASKFKILFAIISKKKSALNIPFFSKVSMKNAKRRLEAIGYNVYLIKIPTKKV